MNLRNAERWPHDTLSARETIVEREFDTWARQGRAHELESHHRYITEKTIPLMDLLPGQRLLDVGCGTGWATRLLAQHVAAGEQSGSVVGLDISAEMIKHAEAESKDWKNVHFCVGSAHQIAWASDYFDKVVSIETFQFIPDQLCALRELLRVMVVGGRLFILMHLYKENTYAVNWRRRIPAHVLSVREYMDLLRRAGFCNVESRHIRDQAPVFREHSPLRNRARQLLQQPPQQWLPLLARKLRTAAAILKFKRLGALLLIGEKPG